MGSGAERAAAPRSDAGGEGATRSAMQVTLAKPRGFCAGVDRAIEIVERALERYGKPVYVLHEIVHNRHVIDRLRDLGARFVESLDSVPSGAVTIFSAHGVSESVVESALERDLRVIDATCPLVTKVHVQAQQYERQGREVILVGHTGHPEVEGTRGRIAAKVHVIATADEIDALQVADPDRVAYVTQTTLSVEDTREVIEALTRRFPKIVGPELKDICYATQNRQDAVGAMSDWIDLLLVVGSPNSSNSNRLRDLGENRNLAAHLIDSADEIDPAWFRDGMRIGLTAGASAPESIVQGVLERLRELGVENVVEMDGKQERIAFKLPEALEPGRLEQV
jgi:4-hydroxy-3-methylbut-2-enyl diphosphate reductase